LRLPRLDLLFVAIVTAITMDDRSSLFRTPVGSFPSLDDEDDDDDALLLSNNNNNSNSHSHHHPTTTLTAKPSAFAGAVLSPKHARDLTPSNCLQIASALAEQSHRRTVVPYTLWITEAWRVLGWAEPSAALFWEVATMYHTLYLAGRAYAADYHEHGGGSLLGGPNAIPPILSCGSASSVGSGTTAHTPVTFDKKKFSTAASAKELPVWLVGTFLLLHCEEFAFWRNLSGKDERRFYDGGVSSGGSADSLTAGEQVDFVSLLRHPSLSPRYVMS
jgi:TBCC domain-containing protein 1